MTTEGRSAGGPGVTPGCNWDTFEVRTPSFQRPGVLCSQQIVGKGTIPRKNADVILIKSGGEEEMYGESNMETYITICKIDSQREFAVWLRKLKQGLCTVRDRLALQGGTGDFP